MKNLVFIRHGKSSWDYDFADDLRPLKKRGVEDGKLIGEELITWNLNPDAIFSSPAKRAYDTCKIISEKIGYDIDNVEISELLYDFDGKRVLNFIINLEEDLDTVILFGHNHAFTALVNSLGSVSISNVPTTGVVWISFNTNDWHIKQTGTTVKTLFPKQLKN
ncbi:phosphohistidine phosphatase SixA [Neptunitalea chrysea]|uniref:Phosphohistidine phosphatase SixA n=1 Tax=Neptunitalea chrysea TaxID=1647581 RepID=A0A9W6B3Q6_9FLAO|nr:histidine phosphatase family protein [Neptunitalea chrysea]GLB51850.1 phosphohistidine phosphatase SixA [Neptunitalea chrysea]